MGKIYGGNEMKKKIVIVILFLAFVFAGCSKVKTQGSNLQVKTLEPIQVVENYFKYYNEKNKKGILCTLTEWHNAPNVVWGFENLDSMKIIDIQEEKSDVIRNGYLRNGRGSVNNTTETNLKVYKVKYEVKYKKNGIGPQDSGTYDWWYFVIRRDEDSPWLIDDMGV